MEQGDKYVTLKITFDLHMIKAYTEIKKLGQRNNKVCI